MTEESVPARTNRRTFMQLAGALIVPVVLAGRPGRAAAAAATPYYLNCYFPNTDEHRLHYSLSTDGYHFTAYSGNPVMTDTVGAGDKLLRDPMILRDVRESGKFHLAATYSWTDRPFVTWDTTSLSSWSNGRVAYPSDATLKQTWAPQFEYDTATGRYLAYWTGCVDNDWNTAAIRYMTTTDFVTWSAPQILFQKSVPVMDASIFAGGGAFHLVYREGATIRQVTSSQGILGPYHQNDHLAVNANYEGPFVYQLTGENTWLMIMDLYGSGGPYAMARSTDAITWTELDSSQFSFPSGAADKVRHGSVLAITAAEYADLTSSVRRLRAYASPERYVRHYSFRARLDATVSPMADSQFRIVPGLGGGGTVSLRSVNFPGYYLRHRNYELWLDPDDGTSLFRNDASFSQRAGLADSSAVSFESLNFAGRYIRQSASLLRLEQISTTTDRSDASFYLV